MTPRHISKSIIKSTFVQTLNYFKYNPLLFTPFAIFASFEFVAIFILYFSYHYPLSLIFGPPIRAFWGEQFLYYPFSLLLLPKLVSLARMALIVVLGSFLTGMAVQIVLDIHNRRRIKLTRSFAPAIKKYVSLFIVVFNYTALFYFITKLIKLLLTKYFATGHTQLLFLKPATWMGSVLSGVNLAIAILIQSAFIYAIPILIIEKEKLLTSIIKSLLLFKKLLVPTIFLVGVPMLIYVPIIVLTYNSAFLIDRLSPVFVVLVLILGTIISSLLIDPLVTVATTVLYLENRLKS